MTGILPQWLANRWPLPHDQPYLRSIELLWTHLISDAVIGIACCSISAALLYLVRRRTARFNRIIVMFAFFIFAAGVMHFVSAWMAEHPVNQLEAIVKVVTAAVALATAIAIWPAVLKAIRLPSNSQLLEAVRQLEHEVVERKRMEEALRQSQATLRELAAYQERIREDERKRIAREIHDELGQNLLALRLDISMLHARTAGAHPRLNEKVGAALGHIDTTMKSIRIIMNNLRPPVLDLGLHAAIEWQVKEFKRMSGVACELVMDSHEPQLAESQAITIFRALQESLTNIRRHARATHVRVELSVNDSRLAMAVKDNGIGIYPDDRRKAHRFGLVGMQERVAMLGGEMHIDSIPGQGTVLRLVIPIRGNPASSMAAGGADM